MHGQRNNLLAGSLVLLSIVAVITAVVVLGSGLEFFGKSTYLVRFSLTDGVAGLKRGASVRVGGKEAGSVSDVSFEQGADGTVTGIMVTLSVNSDVVLRRDAQPLLEVPLLGTVGTINFPVLGSGPALGADEVMEGRIAPPGFLAQAGFGEDEKEYVGNILRSFSDAGGKVNAVLDDVRPVTGDVREKWPSWSGRVDSISSNVDETTARGPEIARKVEERLDQLEEIGEVVDAVIAENRENVRSGLDSFSSTTGKMDAFMDRLENELAAIARDFLENGRDGAARFRDTITKVDEFFEERRPEFRRTLANLRLGSDQLRDTLIEVRRAPWRLVYRPDLRQLNYELLYDSARHYASSVSDLRAATESLESLLHAGEDRQILREASIEELLDQVRRSYENFETAEQAFMEQLLEGPVEPQD